jgi:hypothetical protein
MRSVVKISEHKRLVFIGGGERGLADLDPTLGPLVWCSFLVPSRVESKQNKVPI